MRLDEWQNFIESQFVEGDEQAREPDSQPILRPPYPGATSLFHIDGRTVEGAGEVAQIARSQRPAAEVPGPDFGPPPDASAEVPAFESYLPEEFRAQTGTEDVKRTDTLTGTHNPGRDEAERVRKLLGDGLDAATDNPGREEAERAVKILGDELNATNDSDAVSAAERVRKIFGDELNATTDSDAVSAADKPVRDQSKQVRKLLSDKLGATADKPGRDEAERAQLICRILDPLLSIEEAALLLQLPLDQARHLVFSDDQKATDLAPTDAAVERKVCLSAVAALYERLICASTMIGTPGGADRSGADSPIDDTAADSNPSGAPNGSDADAPIDGTTDESHMPGAPGRSGADAPADRSTADRPLAGATDGSAADAPTNGTVADRFLAEAPANNAARRAAHGADAPTARTTSVEQKN